MNIEAITEILGGKNVINAPINNKIDLIELSEKGLSKDALLNLAQNMNLSIKKMSDILPITERTIQRHSRNDHFSRNVSEQLLQIADVMTRGIEIFGDKDIFIKWLNSPNKALANKNPINLLCSSFGYELIIDELGRIEHGIYS